MRPKGLGSGVIDDIIGPLGDSSGWGYWPSGPLSLSGPYIANKYKGPIEAHDPACHRASTHTVLVTSF